ncbi:hypothetical protein [Pseudalkalibacillus hwajinpoensis]|uniref:RCK N-terminal domain-containing protein n=1 Tax=Guptibacillus hwajinpoensis TaxID=208199 RepID=A0A4U1MFR5_9BACL|nr:hypothetical protein [Pseudalkalibacillus hwajinpoensis]TKD69235.1 hypothetical protein FBF83_14640 [Pseudalkalibacillus hwajinpoensis]
MIEEQTKLILVTPWLRFVKKAKKYNTKICTIWNKEPKGLKILPEIAKISDNLIITDNKSDLKNLIKDYSGLETNDYIVHMGNEDTMEETYEVAELLGLQVNSTNTIKKINNKLEMRQLLDKIGLSSVFFKYIKKMRILIIANLLSQ